MSSQRRSQDLQKIRRSVQFVGRMSDSLIKVGPLSLGIDGVLSWIPGLGEIYSTIAGGFLVMQGVRAGVPIGTLLAAAALLGLRTTVSAAPLAGAVFADMFTAHKWAANMFIREIDKQLASPACGHAGSAFRPPSRPAAGMRGAA